MVTSLIYVALQIRQNTNVVRSAPRNQFTCIFANWYHLIAADTELAPIAAMDCVCFLRAKMPFLKWRQGLLAPSLWVGWAKLSGKTALFVLAKIFADHPKDLS